MTIEISNNSMEQIIMVQASKFRDVYLKVFNITEHMNQNLKIFMFIIL